jgi:hypothetical protein
MLSKSSVHIRTRRPRYGSSMILRGGTRRTPHTRLAMTLAATLALAGPIAACSDDEPEPRPGSFCGVAKGLPETSRQLDAAIEAEDAVIESNDQSDEMYELREETDRLDAQLAAELQRMAAVAPAEIAADARLVADSFDGGYTQEVDEAGSRLVSYIESNCGFRLDF